MYRSSSSGGLSTDAGCGYITAEPSLTSVAQVMRVSWGMMSEDTSYTAAAAAAAAAVSAVATDGRLLPLLRRSRPGRRLTAARAERRRILHGSDRLRRSDSDGLVSRWQRRGTALLGDRRPNHVTITAPSLSE